MIPEALLEMYYFAALRDYYQQKFGARSVKLLKPSSRMEVWFGFDQAWVVTELAETDLFERLRASLHQGAAQLPRTYAAFFLQFKLVHVRLRRSNTTPAGIMAPYLQVNLDLRPSPTTALSQHETLVMLDDLQIGPVAYACPMIFDREEIYRPASLSTLRCAPVSQAPSTWKQNEQHVIVAADAASNRMLWCSEAVPGTWPTFTDWMSNEETLTGTALYDRISVAKRAIAERIGRSAMPNDGNAALSSLIVVEIEVPATDHGV